MELNSGDVWGRHGGSLLHKIWKVLVYPERMHGPDKWRRKTVYVCSRVSQRFVKLWRWWWTNIIQTRSHFVAQPKEPELEIGVWDGLMSSGIIKGVKYPQQADKLNLLVQTGTTWRCENIFLNLKDRIMVAMCVIFASRYSRTFFEHGEITAPTQMSS